MRSSTSWRRATARSWDATALGAPRDPGGDCVASRWASSSPALQAAKPSSSRSRSRPGPGLPPLSPEAGGGTAGLGGRARGRRVGAPGAPPGSRAASCVGRIPPRVSPAPGGPGHARVQATDPNPKARLMTRRISRHGRIDHSPRGLPCPYASPLCAQGRLDSVFPAGAECRAAGSEEDRRRRPESVPPTP